MRLQPSNPPSGCLWLHGASLGEIGGCLRLAQHWAHYSSAPLFITASTLDGWARAQKSPLCQSALLPFDHPSLVGPWLQAMRPQALLLYEGDYWPCLLEHCRQAHIPVLLVSGRFTWRSRLWFWLSRGWDGAHLSGALVQNEKAQEFLRRYTQAPVAVGGDFKVLPDSQAPSLAPMPRTIDLAIVSLHAAEWIRVEALVQAALDAQQVVVLAPRNLSEVPWFHKQMARSGIRVCPWPKTQKGNLSMIDCFGIVSTLLRQSRKALVGGGFGGVGMHDIWEPLRHGVARVYTGNHPGTLREAWTRLQEQGLVVPQGSILWSSDEQQPWQPTESEFASRSQQSLAAYGREEQRAQEGWHKLVAMLPRQF